MHTRSFWFGGLAVLLTACSSKAPVAQESAKPAEPAYFQVDPATAASITGKVTFHGRSPPHKKIDMTEDPQCAGLHKTAVYDDSIAAEKDGSLANVFVYISK